MSDLNELFKVLSEGKKDYETNNPIGKKLKQTKENVKEDLSVLFDQLESLKTMKEDLTEELKVEEAKLPIVKESIPEVLVEADPTPDVSKYLTGKTFQQPNPDLVSKNVEEIRLKIKFLEQAIGRIAAHGPGSGEVNFRWLDDVNRSTINDNWILEYDAETKKFQFTNKIGPIEWVQFDRTHVHDEERIPGTLCWGESDQTLNLAHKNGVVQQIGQEQFILARNRTESTITNGSFVRFAGAEGLDGQSRLLVAPFLANGAFPNLYGLGVATQDIPVGEDGLITTFGKVRELDTTGGSVGESWQLGDILYSSPINPGKFTNFRPTAPNNVIPAAAVIYVNDTLGEIFVRPTFEQRLAYATFSDTTDQNIVVINTPYALHYNITNISSGFTLGGNPQTQIIAEQSGYYSATACLSLTSTNASDKAFFIWARKNGVDIPYSARRQSIVGNGIFVVFKFQVDVSLLAGDYIEIMYASNSTSLVISSPGASAFAPAIPSVSVILEQVAL